MAVAIDVTAQILARQKIEDIVKDRTEALAKANNDLQKSNAELAQFAYIASHDLQEPIRKISTFSEMLTNNLRDKIDDESIRYLYKIGKSATRMITLIKGVLNYSELIKENEIFEETDLNKIVESVLLDYDLSIEQKEASIQFTSLPIIQANPLQMSQLFGNIIGNSLKFVREGQQPVITISATDPTEEDLNNAMLRKDLAYTKIQFSDNGIGFTSDYSDQIFGIFQRLHRRSEYAGTGIGLALCKKIAMNHQGTINAQGSNEKGAIFNVIIPKSQDTKPESHR